MHVDYRFKESVLFYDKPIQVGVRIYSGIAQIKKNTSQIKMTGISCT